MKSELFLLQSSPSRFDKDTTVSDLGGLVRICPSPGRGNGTGANTLHCCKVREF